MTTYTIIDRRWVAPKMRIDAGGGRDAKSLSTLCTRAWEGEGTNVPRAPTKHPPDFNRLKPLLRSTTCVGNVSSCSPQHPLTTLGDDQGGTDLHTFLFLIVSEKKKVAQIRLKTGGMLYSAGQRCCSFPKVNDIKMRGFFFDPFHPLLPPQKAIFLFCSVRCSYLRPGL